MLKKRPDSPNWQVEFGTDFRRSTRIPHSPSDPKEAEENEKLAGKINRRWELQRIQTEQLGDHSALSFKEACAAYLKAHDHDPTWGKREKDVIGWLLNETDDTHPQTGSPDLGTWSLKQVADWDALVALQGICTALGHAPRNTNRVLSVVSAVIHSNPKWFPTRVRIPRLTVKKKERPYIPAERIPDVCAHLQWHQTLAVNFAVLTLLRMRAMLSLRWEHVFPSHRWAVIRPEYQKNNRSFGFALTDRHLEILASLRQFQQDQWEEHVRVSARLKRKVRANWDHEFVFTWYGKRIRNCNTNAFKRAVRNAGCPAGFNWHSWRHVGATLARLAGMSLPDLQALGGWESIASVQVYAHINPATMMPAAQRLAAQLPQLADIARMRTVNAQAGVAFSLPAVRVGSAPGETGPNGVESRNAACALFGGAGRDRTGDLFIANEALSQLSYSPNGTQNSHSEGSSSAGIDLETALALNDLAAQSSSASAALRTPPTNPSPSKQAKLIKHLERTRKQATAPGRPKKAGCGR
jgi:integrase